MSYREVSLVDATKTELYEFATKIQQIEVPTTANKAVILARLQAASYMNDFILVKDDEAEGSFQSNLPTNSEPGMSPKAANGDPIVTVLVAQTNDAGGDRPIPVGVNGSVMLIARGKPQPIPYRYYLAMQAAVGTQYAQDLETGELSSRQVPTYSFSVVTPAPADQVAAWEAQEAAESEAVAKRQIRVKEVKEAAEVTMGSAA